MKAILHIGPPKTGTTTLQAVFFHNREALLKQGLEMFVGTKASPRALSSLFEDSDKPIRPGLRKSGLSSKGDVMAWSNANWEALEQQVAESKAKAFLISSEHFATIAEVGGFIDRIKTIFDDVRVIAYLRDPVSLYSSAIASQIRTGGSMLRELKDPWRYNYTGLGKIFHYSAAFGTDKVVVRNFDRKHLFNGDLVADFFQTLDTSFDVKVTYEPVEGERNQSLCGAATAWMMTLNEILSAGGRGGVGEQLKQRKALIERLRASPALKELPKLKVPENFRDALLETNRSRLEKYNETFLPEDTRIVLPDADAKADKPTIEEGNQMMADWLMSYLDGDAMKLVAKEAVQPVTRKDMRRAKKAKAKAKAEPAS